MADFQTLLVQDQGPVRLLTLNRPEMFNPLDFTSGPELITALEEAGREASVRALVLTGAGKAFSAGANVRLMQQGLSEGRSPSPFFSELAAILHRSISTLRRLPKPVVCALNGVAAGGGMGWALACDLVVASRLARLDPAYIRIGLTPDGGSTALLARALGLQRASELFMLGRPLDAGAALEMGLVNQVVEPGELLETALAVAGELAAGPATALAETKALLNRSLYGDLEAVMENERQSICRMSEGPEFVEGITAFFQKRKPDFA